SVMCWRVNMSFETPQDVREKCAAALRKAVGDAVREYYSNSGGYLPVTIRLDWFEPHHGLACGEARLSNIRVELM
ncbi:MAG: hypothetical protein ACRDAM_10050, partial [Casimicrobium sp.]